MTERRADEATRDAIDALKCEFMSERLGQEFSGMITSVLKFGFFVELQDLYIEGLVHIRDLHDDRYRFDKASHRLIGERMGKVFTMGQSVRVKVVRVDVEQRQIDLQLPTPRQGRLLGERNDERTGLDFWNTSHSYFASRAS